MPREPFVPRPYQAIGTDWALNEDRSNLWAGMGMGKTVTVLTALDILFNVEGEPGPALILAPLRVARSVWPAEAQKWSHLEQLTVVPIIGTRAQREAALRTKAQVYVINYDNIIWLRKHLGRQWPFRIVVADESTRLKGFRLRQGGRRPRALAQPAHSVVRRWINLSGTPAPNGLMDLWGQQWFVDAGERLGSSFSAFENRWFAYVRNPHSVDPSERFKIQQKPLPFAEEQIHERLADCSLTLDPHDWFDFLDPIPKIIEVDLPAQARRYYQEMERTMFTQLASGEDVEAAARGAALMKCMQISSGMVYHSDSDGDPEKAGLVHKAKLEALDSVVEEAAGMPVLVSYFFKTDLLALQKHFPKGRVFDDNPETEAAWNNGEIPVMFLHPSSAGHGLNLQHGGNIIVFFSLWWDKETHDQVIERIGPVRQIQAGYDRPVHVVYLVGKKTVDQAVLAKHAQKTSVEDALLEYMALQRRPTSG